MGGVASFANNPISKISQFWLVQNQCGKGY